MRLEVWHPHELVNVTHEVHDFWFDLDDLMSQGGDERVLQILDQEERRTLFGFRTKAGGQMTPVARLCIRHVERVHVKDTERIGYYNINELQYTPGRLRIATCVPLFLEFEINNLHVVLETLVQTQNPPTDT